MVDKWLVLLPKNGVYYFYVYMHYTQWLIKVTGMFVWIKLLSMYMCFHYIVYPGLV